MSLDHITFAWLIASALFTLLHTLRTWRARSARSVSLPATLFFTLFAGWNVFFFTALGQFWSCAGSAALLIAHALWLALQIHYRDRRASHDYDACLPILDIMK